MFRIAFIVKQGNPFSFNASVGVASHTVKSKVNNKLRGELFGLDSITARFLRELFHACCT